MLSSFIMSVIFTSIFMFVFDIKDTFSVTVLFFLLYLVSMVQKLYLKLKDD